jgi:transposase InsO family protein
MSDPSSSSMTYQGKKLTGPGNWLDWSRGIWQLLRAKKMVKHVNKQGDKDDEEDQQAAGFILAFVENHLHSIVPRNATAYDTWQALTKKYEQSGPQVLVNTLITLANLRYIEGNKIEDHLTKATDLYSQLDSAGVVLPDLVKAVWLINSLPRSWSAFVVAQTSAPTTAHLTVEAVSTAILAERDRLILDQQASNSLIDSSSALATVHRPPPPQRPSPSRRRDVTCAWCLKRGHEEHECRGKQAGAPRANHGSHANAASPVPPPLHLCFTALPDVPVDSGVWYIDSGASTHYCHEAHLVHSVVSCTGEAVASATGSRVPVVGIGSVTVHMATTDKSDIVVTLTNVSFAPALTVNLLSVSRLTAAGLDVRFTRAQCIIRHGRRVIATADLVPGNKLYRLRVRSPSPSVESPDPGQLCLIAAGTPAELPPSTLWHRRMGHAHHKAVSNLLGGDMTADVRLRLDSTTEHCESCVFGKHHRTAVLSSAVATRATRPLYRLHLDICGPFTRAYNGSLYLLQIVDDYTRYDWARCMPNREAQTVLTHLETFVTLAEAMHTGLRVCVLRSDNGPELVGELVSHWLTSRGIVRERTATYSPHQNGVVERMNRVIVELGRTMLIASELPKKFWPLAIDTAVYCRNRCPTTTLDGLTPYEAWFGSKPKVSHMRIFGCRAFVHVRKEERDKLDPKAKSCIFVGYSADSSTYRLWDDTRQRLLESRDVYFVEGQLGIKAKGATASTALPQFDLNDTITTEEALPIAPAHSEVIQPQPEQPNAQPPAPQPRPRPLSRELRALQDTNRPGVRDHAPSAVANLCLIAHANISHSTKAAIDSDPTTFKAAMDSPQQSQWRSAMDSEMASLKKAGTFTLVPLPPNRTAIGCKWVYKTKRGADGALSKHKARLVAKGFLQRYGVDYDLTYAPVARYSSIRAIVALTAHHDWELHQMDVKSAYLNGDLEEDIYMTQPEGYQVAGKEQLVCKLSKSLYGLKQAGRTWHIKIDIALKRQDFTALDADECVYIKRHDSCTTIIALYVDDLLIACSSTVELNKLKRDLTTQFDMEDLGEATFILGIDITRDRPRRTISIGQSAYITSVLERHGMSDCTPISTPMTSDYKTVIVKSPVGYQATDTEVREYQAIIGAVMFAMVCTRPDIAFAVNTLAQFTSNPTPGHVDAVKRILRYLRGTVDRRITYTGTGSTESQPDLVGYCDADWGGGVGYRSVTGYAFVLAGGAISWQSKRQKTVALSTVEAEYMATTEAVKEAIWWRSFLGGLGHDVTRPTTLYSDNQGSIALAHNPEHHARTKHIAIRYHFIREHVADKTISLTFIGTSDMAADFFTKALERVAHERGAQGLGQSESRSRGGVDMAR